MSARVNGLAAEAAADRIDSRSSAVMAGFSSSGAGASASASGPFFFFFFFFFFPPPSSLAAAAPLATSAGSYSSSRTDRTDDRTRSMPARDSILLPSDFDDDDDDDGDAAEVSSSVTAADHSGRAGAPRHNGPGVPRRPPGLTRDGAD